MEIQLVDTTAVEQFVEFYAREHNRLIWTLAKAGATPTEAEDAAQEGMLVLLHAWTTVTSPKPFVRTVALRALYRTWSRRRRERQSEMRTAPRDAWVQTFDANEDVDKILRLLEELPPAQREVFVMAEEGIPDKEIAEIIGKKEATVRSTLRHAREKVTNALNLKTTRKEVNHGPLYGP